MKISTKFVRSSVGLGALIIALVGGTNLWVQRQEVRIEQKESEIRIKKDAYVNLQLLIDEQIIALKDFVVLGRSPEEFLNYDNTKAEFLRALAFLEEQDPDNPTLISLADRYVTLTRIADNLEGTFREDAILQQDLRSLNSFHRDIELYIDELRQDTDAELTEAIAAKKAVRKLFTQVVWMMGLLIALLMFLQYKTIINPVLLSLKQLSEGTQRIGLGDFNYRLNIAGEDEIAGVAQTFDLMVETLANLYDELEQKIQERTRQIELKNLVLRDEINKREIIEDELRGIFETTKKSQQLLSSIINASPDWIFVKDTRANFILVNHSFANHFDLSPDEVVGKSIEDLQLITTKKTESRVKTSDIIQDEDQQVLLGNGIHNPSDMVTDANGITYILDTQKLPLLDETGRIVGILGVSRDVTERHFAQEALEQSESALRQKADELAITLQQLQQTQSQIIQSEKMSSLGQMVAGVAHEINNPVNFIFGNINHARDYIQDLIGLLELYRAEYPEPSEEIQAEIEEIELDYLMDDIPKLLSSMTVGAERIREIVKSLRVFSRVDESDMKKADIHAGIDSTLMILQHRLKEKKDKKAIAIQRNYGELPLVQCYPGQLNQVFMNILSNALDALEEQEKDAELQQNFENLSEITITTEPIGMVDQKPEAIAIHISDNGTGMPEETRRKLFEPFFTTKDVGKGTGLGLSISHSIITDKHGGKLTCESEPGKGAKFTIQIPVQAKLS